MTELKVDGKVLVFHDELNQLISETIHNFRVVPPVSGRPFIEIDSVRIHMH